MQVWEVSIISVIPTNQDRQTVKVLNLPLVVRHIGQKQVPTIQKVKKTVEEKSSENAGSLGRFLRRPRPVPPTVAAVRQFIQEEINEVTVNHENLLFVWWHIVDDSVAQGQEQSDDSNSSVPEFQEQSFVSRPVNDASVVHSLEATVGVVGPVPQD